MGVPGACVTDGELPENPDAQKKLRRKLSHLAIEAPEFKPYSSWKAKVSGALYKVKSGSFNLYCDGSVSPDADWFSFDFSPMEGCIRWTAKDRRRCTVIFALDGTRRWNRVESPWSHAEECWASGAWETDDRFRLNVKWTENQVNKTLHFNFSEDGVTVTEKGISGPPNPGKPLLMETVAVRIR